MSADRRLRAQLVVNPHASSVDASVQQRLLSELAEGLNVETCATHEKGGARELAAQALADGDAELLITVGGDGTVNEVAQALAGSDLPLVPLPGGSTSVFARALGYPNDVRAAARRLLDGELSPRRIDLGHVSGDGQPERRFLFSAGIGVDAAVVQRVDAQPALKRAFRGGFFAAVAAATVAQHYLGRAPSLIVESGDGETEGVTAALQNGPIFSFLGRRPLRLSPHARADDGRLGLAVLRAAPVLGAVGLGRTLLSGEPQRVADHRDVASMGAITAARIRALGHRRLPLQVDGEFLGEFGQVEVGVRPGALLVLA